MPGVAASALACASAVAGDPGDPKVPGSSGVGVVVALRSEDPEEVMEK